jgi:hypothetical protein
VVCVEEAEPREASKLAADGALAHAGHAMDDDEVHGGSVLRREPKCE